MAMFGLNIELGLREMPSSRASNEAMMFPSFAVCPEGRLLSISLRADMGLPDGEDLRCGRQKAPLPPLPPPLAPAVKLTYELVVLRGLI